MADEDRTPPTPVKPAWMLSFFNYMKLLYDQFMVAWVAHGYTVATGFWPLPSACSLLATANEPMRRKLWNSITTMLGLYKHGGPARHHHLDDTGPPDPEQQVFADPNNDVI